MRPSHDDFLKADDRRPEEVSLDGIPGYDGSSVLVRGLSGAERDEFETNMLVRRGNKLEKGVTVRDLIAEGRRF